MSLTEHDRDAARLDQLLTQLSETDPLDALALQAAHEGLLEFENSTTFEDLEDRAIAAVAHSSTAAANGFAAHFEAITEQVESAGKTISAAAKLAAEGEKGLALNRLNNYLGRTVKVIEEGKKAVEKLKELGEIADGSAEDAKAKIEAAIDSVKAVQQALQNA